MFLLAGLGTIGRSQVAEICTKATYEKINITSNLLLALTLLSPSTKHKGVLSNSAESSEVFYLQHPGPSPSAPEVNRPHRAPDCEIQSQCYLPRQP